MIETYLTRRKNIFAILGKNDADQDQIQSFNSEYFDDESFAIDDKTLRPNSTTSFIQTPELGKNLSTDSDLVEVTQMQRVPFSIKMNSFMDTPMNVEPH